MNGSAGASSVGLVERRTLGSERTKLLGSLALMAAFTNGLDRIGYNGLAVRLE
jgi:hypothetical protein